MTLRHFSLAATLATTLALASPAYAVTEIQWWHALTGANNDVVVKLAEEFNASQSDYKVVASVAARLKCRSVIQILPGGRHYRGRHYRCAR
jgi:ABC-type glycerol-3-phosphate transport system substrate-binding protein